MIRTVQLSVLSSVNIGITFWFQWFILIQLGPGMETDALFAGMTIPQLVIGIISGSLVHVLVPLLAGESECRLRSIIWGLFVLSGVLFGLLALLLYVTAPWWVSLILPGFDEAGKMLTIELTRIQLIGMIFASINSVQLASYHAREQFLWAEMTSILASFFPLLLLIWALPQYGVAAAAWIGVLRNVVQTLLLAPVMGKPTRPDLKSTTIRKAWQRIKPLLFGTTYYKTDPLIDRLLLSAASSGSLSLYYFAQQIYGAVNQVISKAIATPLVPLLGKLYKAGDREAFMHAYYRKILQVGSVIFLGLLSLVLFGEDILDLLIGHGNVSSNNVKELWWIMIWLGGIFAGGALGQISSSSFYALGDTKTPTLIGVYSYTIYIPVKIAIFFYFGVLGLALITSIFVLMNFLLQHCQLKKKYFLKISTKGKPHD